MREHETLYALAYRFGRLSFLNTRIIHNLITMLLAAAVLPCIQLSIRSLNF